MALAVAAFACGYAADAGAAVLAAVQSTDPTIEEHPDRLSDQTAISACAIRLDSSRSTGAGDPSVHVNSSHFCSGVQSVERDADGDLLVHSEPGGAIGACIAKEDETLAKLAIQAGCSGGNETTLIKFYRMGKHIRIEDINSPYANVWLLWVADPLGDLATPTPTPTETSTETPMQTPAG